MTCWRQTPGLATAMATHALFCTESDFGWGMHYITNRPVFICKECKTVLLMVAAGSAYVWTESQKCPSCGVIHADIDGDVEQWFTPDSVNTDDIWVADPD